MSDRRRPRATARPVADAGPHGPSAAQDPAAVPAARPSDPRPAAPPELDFHGRKHRRALQDATLWDMARRIPTALAQSARLAWSVDRRMTLTILVCQVLSGLGTAVVLTAVSKAMPTSPPPTPAPASNGPGRR
ncbi:hypothetical protein [Streptomyces sp. 184]|uniref:hypothetical protein n=1 Tax=Streptomyces sp. 184 TaxID=1827526 RepID=UPI0038921D05